MGGKRATGMGLGVFRKLCYWASGVIYSLIKRYDGIMFLVVKLYNRLLWFGFIWYLFMDFVRARNEHLLLYLLFLMSFMAVFRI